MEAAADPVGRFWAHATAFGAAWGVFELTVGTFLHTLRIPFAGMLLACAGAALLVAERQVLPARGLTLATGIVAAACKSISPGGVIFGPMVGITTEALLVEAALIVAPRAWASALVAGTAAALWPLTQGLLAQLLLYGGTLVELYGEGLRRLAGAARLSGAQAGGMAAALLGLLALLGSAAALVGKLAGRRAVAALRESGVAVLPGVAPPVSASGRLPPDAPSLETARWLPAWLAPRADRLLGTVAVAAVAIQIGGGLPASLVSVAALVTALALLRPAAAAKLARPKFWIASLLLATASGLLLGPRDLALPGGGTPLFSSTGARAGMVMVLRGTLVFSLTAWLAVALPASRWMRRAGRAAGPVGRAVQGALGLLPHLRRVLGAPLPGGRRASLWQRAAGLVTEAARLAEAASRERPGGLLARPLVAALVGPRGSGKTRIAARIARALASRGIAAGGVCQPARENRLAYDLVDLRSGACRELARRAPARLLDTLPAAAGSGRAPRGAPAEASGSAFADTAPGAPPDGGGAAIVRTAPGAPPERAGSAPASAGIGYVVDEGTLAWGADLVAQATRACAVVIVDEVGRLEARGLGHWPAVEQALRHAGANGSRGPGLLMLAVQAAVAPAVERRTGGFWSVLELPASDAEVEAFVAGLARAVNEDPAGAPRAHPRLHGGVTA